MRNEVNFAGDEADTVSLTFVLLLQFLVSLALSQVRENLGQLIDDNVIGC